MLIIQKTLNFAFEFFLSLCRFYNVGAGGIIDNNSFCIKYEMIYLEVKMKKIILYTLLLSLFFNLSCYANQTKKEIRKEIKKYEKDISNNIGDKAENFYKLGVLNYKINKIKKAKTNFEILTLIEPKHHESYIYLGDIALFDNKDNEKAFLNYTFSV